VLKTTKILKILLIPEEMPNSLKNQNLSSTNYEKTAPLLSYKNR